MNARQNGSIALVVFLYGLLLFTMGLDHREVIGFESRFYLFALEMMRHGPTWFPVTYHMPYPDYPATSTFFIYVFSKIAGELSKWTVVFPSAFASAMTLAVTYLIGATQSRRLGFIAVAFLLLTHAFVAEARTISLDQYTTFITAACFYLVLKPSFFSKKITSLMLFSLLVFGFAIRGPIGLVIPAGVISVFYLMDHDIKNFLTFGLITAILLVLCVGVLLGLAYHVGNASFVDEVLQKEVLGRMETERALPFYFYFTESIAAYALSFPLAMLVFLGGKREGKFLWKLFGWVFVILLGLSIPADKRIRYILPMAPALALICGYLFTFSWEKKKYFYFLQRIFFYLISLLPLMSLLALLVVYINYPEFDLAYKTMGSVLALLQVSIFFIGWKTKIREMIVLFVASLSFVLTYAFIAEPINLSLNRTRDFVIQAEELRQKNHAKLVFYREGKDGLVIKYLVNMPREETPIFIQDIDQLRQFAEPAIFIATEEHFQQIPHSLAQSFRMVMKGKVGRESFVVFIPVVPHAVTDK